MTVVTGMVERSVDLKQALVEFGQRPRFAKALRSVIRKAGDGPAEDGGKLINTLDFFVLQHRLADGSTVVDHFVAAHPDLPERDREMLQGWRDVVEGLFEVQRHDRNAILLFNVIDELIYRTYSNAGTAVFAQMPRGSFVAARLVPIGQEWLFSGSQSVFPPSARREIARLAAQFSLQRPALVFRNPDMLRRGWELQRQDRADFVEFFGTDLVVLPSAQLAERMQAYWEHHTRRIADRNQPHGIGNDGRIAGLPATSPELELPPDLIKAETIGVIYDDVEGLYFYADFALIAEAFANPQIVNRQPYHRKVQSYLRDDSISPLPFRRLAEQDTAKASRLFQLLLKQPTFSWEADGEPLLRHRKRAFFDKPALPSIVPLGGMALEHYRSAAPDRGARRQGRGDRDRRGLP